MTTPETMEERFDDFLSEAELTEVNSYAEDRIKDFIRKENELAVWNHRRELREQITKVYHKACEDIADLLTPNSN